MFSSLLFNRNQFGAHVKIVGDNSDSARQMGIDVNWVRVKAFVFVGLGAALAGFFSTMINFTWWPTSGDGYLLPALASVFVGGTPTWGGVGTVGGGAIGALIVSFIQTGNRRRGPERILRPVLQRADHHPVPDRTSMEPDPLSLITAHAQRSPTRARNLCRFPGRTAPRRIAHFRHLWPSRASPSPGAMRTTPVLTPGIRRGGLTMSFTRHGPTVVSRKSARSPVDCSSKASDPSNAGGGGRSVAGNARIRGNDPLHLSLENLGVEDAGPAPHRVGAIPAPA